MHSQPNPFAKPQLPNGINPTIPSNLSTPPPTTQFQSHPGQHSTNQGSNHPPVMNPSYPMSQYGVQGAGYPVAQSAPPSSQPPPTYSQPRFTGSPIGTAPTPLPQQSLHQQSAYQQPTYQHSVHAQPQYPPQYTQPHGNPPQVTPPQAPPQAPPPQPAQNFTSHHPQFQTHSQPPFSAQQPPQQAASQPPGPRIDPSQIPSPTALADGRPVKYRTLIGQPPGPAACQYVAIDEANATPRFVRLTMYTFPCAEDVHQTSHIPFAMIVQPLAEVGAGEESVPLVDFSSVGGPLRCRRCRAYINPFNVFVDGGRKFVCKFCDCENDVPDGYFSPLEANGKRHDLTSRPELTRGSVDFVASSDYIQKQLGPLRYVFVVDVSEYAVSSGMLQVLLDSLRTFLNGLCESGSASKVAIITFDSTVHFWNLRGSLQQPQMMVVPEVTNMFVPLGGGGLFFSYKESKAVVDYFLEKLAVMFTSGARSSPEAFSAAIQAASLALASGGGRILAFTAGTPDSETKRRDDIKLFGTDKERTLYAPRSPALKALAAECASRSTAIDMFVCPPPGTCDLVSLAALTNTTGGNLYYYPSFTSERDGGRLRAETARTLIRPFGYDAIAKVRCSKGITVSDYLGNLRVSNSQDVEFAGIDGDKAIVVALKHDDKLEEKSEPVLQFAMLYTTVGGERRIRVHNVSVNCSPTLPNLFRGADLDSILNVYAHIAIRAIPNNTLSEVRNMIAEKCVDVLAAYRKYCASSTSPGQLILPESLKLLPVFVLALSKSLMLRPGNDITADDRAFYMALFNSAGPAITTPLIYPRLYALHKIGDEYGIPDTEGRIVLPTPLRLTTDGLDADGAYLVENGVDMFLWLGRNTSPVLINELQSALIHNHPVGGFGERVLTMYTAIRQQRCKGAELRIVRSRDLLENKLFAMLVEDRSASGEQNSYVDFLCTVHKHIQNKLA